MATIVLLHTNDLHGHLTSWQGGEGELKGKRIGGFDRLAGAVARTRRDAGENVLLLDAGDLIGDTMLADLTSGYDAVALIRVSMPLTFRAERAELARAQAQLERSQASREQAELRLRQRVAELCRALNSGSESLRVAKLSLAARQKKIEEEVHRHAEGLLSTHDLRIAQEELDGAELNELQARLALLGNQAALGQLDGNLAGRHGISL